MTHRQTSKTKNVRRLPLTVTRITRRDAKLSAAMTERRNVRVSRQRRTSPSKNESVDFLPRSLFTCGSLMPSQFFLPAQQSLMCWRGEQRLLFAVLQDAVACWFRYRDATTPRGRRLFGETVAWFESPDTNWLYAFERICELLALDPDYIRRGLRGWRSGVSIPSTLPGGVRRRIDSRRPFWPA
jgi:hypothetical protein